jgi:predicted unusual protein kinase regulating ubiquinone biosynthesis (AarF/ABC1/UbiB family)
MPNDTKKNSTFLLNTAFPYDDVRAAVKSETGKFPEEIFHSIHKKPIAAASIGQVHKAT